MDRHPLHPAPITADHAAALLNDCAADLAGTLRTTPIGPDLLRIRAVVEQRNAARFTVAEVSELERTHQALVDALHHHRQGAFSLHDLRCAVFDAGFAMDEYCGDPAVFFTPGRSLEQDKNEFIADLALAAPRYAHAIVRAAQWSPGANCMWWDAKEIARLAA